MEKKFNNIENKRSYVVGKTELIGVRFMDSEGNWTTHLINEVEENWKIDNEKFSLLKTTQLNQK